MNVNAHGIRFKDAAKKLAGYALIEMFVPGGTLIIFGLLMAGHSIPGTSGRVFARFTQKAGRLWPRMNLIGEPHGEIVGLPGLYRRLRPRTKESR